MLAFLEPSLQAQQTRLRHVEKTLRCPPQSAGELTRFLENVDFLKQVTKAGRDRFAAGGPSWTALEPYLRASGLDGLIHKQQLAVKSLRESITWDDKPGDFDTFKPCVVALAAVVAAERAIVALIGELQQRIISELDGIGDVGADTNADNGSDAPIRLPEDPLVIRLAKEINDRLDDEGSKISIARQLTDGDDKKAQSLLRQLRRYPHLLRKRQK
jgi:hypothetical protein